MTSRQMGRSIVDSVNDAKEVTVNFNKKGVGYKTGGFFGITAGIMRNLCLSSMLLYVIEQLQQAES